MQSAALARKSDAKNNDDSMDRIYLKILSAHIENKHVAHNPQPM